jgi:PucR C-terminal helix-turn-helix domain/GGDEF-like domain
MNPAHGHRSASTASQLRTGLLERLRARRPEIEQVILTRAYSIADPTEVGDPVYVEGLRAAVSAALGYALTGIEQGDAEPGPIPAELFAQARHAARDGVSLDTVLRRYFAGHTLLTDFLMQEAERSDLFGFEDLQALGKTQAMLVDRLIASISEEYRREAERKTSSRAERQLDSVHRLLAGELADTSGFAYDFDAWHLAAIAVGPAGDDALRSLAATFDRRPLFVRPDEHTSWAWLGGSRMIDREEVERLASFDPPGQAFLAVGEPAQGLDGWRFSHRQATAALPVAMRSPGKTTRYADVALLASMLQDEVLTASLREMYLAPLAAEDRDGGATLRKTLRAYFSTERNVSSTALSLGVDRKTVTSRLRVIEQRLGRPLAECGAELEAALHLQEMGDLTTVPPVIPPAR